MERIILDRSTLERYASCPQSGYLGRIYDALVAQNRGQKITEEEKALLAEMDSDLRKRMEQEATAEKTDKLRTTGALVHELIERAFQECRNDISGVPDWFSERLPSIRPDVHPDAIRAARYVADCLADFHTNLIGVEVQIEHEFLPPLKSRGPVYLTTRLDVLSSGKSGLHVWDWKCGYKKRSNSEAAASFQAQFIAFLLWQQPEYESINTVHFWYQEVRWGTVAYARFIRGEEHPRLPHLTTEAAIKGRIESSVRLYLENNKECWPEDSKCLQCDYVRYCNLAASEAAEIAEDPKGFVDKLIVDAASVQRRQKAVNEWVRAHGPLAGTKMVFDKKPPSNRFTVELRRIDAQRPECSLTGDEDIDNHFI
ncbi:MAG TPA: PD-(D/E)XK nuclease family protein [Anaerohalosphaeraceae bacterium]|nr:PD-(D/E)XK nuclease family protein [Anaerohalosphaeraceae bacterium]